MEPRLHEYQPRNEVELALDTYTRAGWTVMTKVPVAWLKDAKGY